VRTDPRETIPVSWIVRSAILVGLVLIAALVLSVAARCTGHAAPAAPAVDRAAQLRALLDGLEHGRTCADRRAQIAPLVALGDRAAIEPLQRARARTTGADSNACLIADADAALRALR
jgi:hypothetical protein